MRKEALLAMFTCIMAALGSFIRWMQNNRIYEERTGLAVPSVWSGIMIAACVFTAAGLLLMTLRLKRYDAKEDYRSALRARTVLYPITALALGIGMIVGVFFLIRERGTIMYPGANTVLAVFAVLCGVSFPMLAMGPKKDSSGTLLCVSSVMPIAFFCCWLIVSYRENASNPVLWSFALEILAIGCAILGFYYLAGYAFNKPDPLRAVFFSQLGAFLCTVTLGDGRIMGKQLFFLMSAVMLIMQSTVLAARMTTKNGEGRGTN